MHEGKAEKKKNQKLNSSRIHCHNGNPQVSQKHFSLTLIKPIARNCYESEEVSDVTALNDNDLDN